MRAPGFVPVSINIFFVASGGGHHCVRSRKPTPSRQVNFKITHLANSAMRRLRGLNRLLQHAYFGVRFGHFLLRF
jgi:hypothetical protein